MAETTVAAEGPVAGREYRDATGRVLRVDGIYAGDRLGREVRGVLVGLDAAPTREYTCSFAIWAAVWRDAEPPVRVRQ